MSAIDWNHLERLIHAMTPRDLRRLLLRVRAALNDDRSFDLEGQRQAIARMQAKLERIEEDDRHRHRGFSARDHDEILYGEDGQ